MKATVPAAPAARPRVEVAGGLLVADGGYLPRHRHQPGRHQEHVAQIDDGPRPGGPQPANHRLQGGVAPQRAPGGLRDQPEHLPSEGHMAATAATEVA
ncbi:MAG: hypothetical protein OEW29_03280 [Acidimicrobiia bacterium]|nr:hypothetical protein [Acidimicrobiia bacterium]